MLKLYAAVLPSLYLLLRFLSLFHGGIRESLSARAGLMERWRKADLGKNRLWFHVSSVGELEQVRPVLETLAAGKNHSLILSYFSPSVPRLVKDWGFVHHADYLPLDFPAEMRELMGIVKPELLVLNRYDLWPHHLLAAKEQSVPVVLVNASTPPLGLFGSISLAARSFLFLAVDAWTFVDAAAASAWEPYVINRARGFVAGNPRVDRALQRVERAVMEGKAKERLQRWRRRDFCLVAGSTWEKDEELLLKAWERFRGEGSLVLVPHEPTAEHVERLLRRLRREGYKAARLTALEGQEDAEVLVVDERGYLAEIYGLARIAYVGGGFGRQIHSIIEPIAHGVPVAFGPHFARTPEAVTLCAAGVGFSSRSPERLSHWLSELRGDGAERRRAAENLKVFVQIHRGAGERVAEFLLGCLGNSGILSQTKGGQQ